MNLQELKNQKEQRTSNTLKNHGVFFAFSNEQFEKNKTPLEEGDKYVSIGAGGYMPKSKAEQFFIQMEDDNKWFNACIKEYDLRKKLIAYELANHEAFYTGELEDTINALGSDYTEEEVRQVYNENYHLYDF